MPSQSGPAVNQWLTGKTKHIDPRYLADVAACTNASLNWLMTGKGDPGREARDARKTRIPTPGGPMYFRGAKWTPAQKHHP